MSRILDELWDKVETTRQACLDTTYPLTDESWMALGEYELALDTFGKALDKGDDSIHEAQQEYRIATDIIHKGDRQ